jgi:hypothetical protein
MTVACRSGGRSRDVVMKEFTMNATTHVGHVSKGTVWTGRILTGLPVVFMIWDGVMKLIKIQPVIDATERLGYPVGSIVGLGVVDIVCAVLYAIPRTSVLGAVLLSGYLGGAVASHLRIGEPFWFPFLVGALVWGGLFLRDERIRALLPLTSPHAR